MKMEIEGLDKLQKEIEDLKKNIEEHEEETVSLDELLNQEFMQKYTQFSDFDEMIDSSKFEIETQDDFDDLFENEDWDDYVIDTTKFKDWEEMMQTAETERLEKILGFN